MHVQKYLYFFLILFSSNVYAQKVVLKVPSLHCSSCILNMRVALKSIVDNPKKDIIINLETKEVKIKLNKLNENISPKEISAKIKNAGYQAIQIKKLKS